VNGSPAPVETEREPQADNASLRSRAPVRVGRRQIAGWFAPEVARQLHMIALEGDTTLQAIMAEAFNDVFTKRGKPPIA
jgi:hypothetical protein